MFKRLFVTMLFFHLAFALLGAISPVAASPSQLSIPQVSSVVSSVTSSFAPAVTYAGPTGSASAALKTSSTTKISSAIVAATSAAAPYWLESITHQGISAFNSNPASYQVFRNVKSFGAKGEGSVSRGKMIAN
jgi:glucan 1,3-beta-glucosidase